jgi:protein-tyrosine phosphatase
VGHAGEGSDFRLMFDAGIKALVQLAVEELLQQAPRELICCRFPLLDGSGNGPEILSLAINTVANLIRHHIPTLVACGAGMSRSPAVVAAALSLVHRESPEECLKRVIRAHPGDVSPALWGDIIGILSSAL